MNVKTIRLALVLGIAGALTLGACKSASPTPPEVTGTPTQSSATATFTPRPTRLPTRTAKPKPTLPGTAYPGPVQPTPLITSVITPEPTQAPHRDSSPGAHSNCFSRDGWGSSYTRSIPAAQFKWGILYASSIPAAGRLRSDRSRPLPGPRQYQLDALAEPLSRSRYPAAGYSAYRLLQ